MLSRKWMNRVIGVCLSATIGFTAMSFGHSSFLPTASAATSYTSDQVIQLAKSYIGRVSYDWGTRNPSSLVFDCSSFTQFIFSKVGVDLEWGTRQQKDQGYAVSKSNLEKGDLVFFDTIRTNNNAINHVGIYIGNGNFIHNTPSVDGITISSLSEGWWTGHYVSARRVM